MDIFYKYFSMGAWRAADFSDLVQPVFFIVLLIVYTFAAWRRGLVLALAFTLASALGLALSASGVFSVSHKAAAFALVAITTLTAIFGIFGAGQQTVGLVGKNRVCHDHSVRRILRTIVRKRLRRRRRHVVPDSVFFDRIGRRRGIAGAGCTGRIVASSVFRMQPARYCDGHLIRSGRHNDTVPC